MKVGTVKRSLLMGSRLHKSNLEQSRQEEQHSRGRFIIQEPLLGSGAARFLSTKLWRSSYVYKRRNAQFSLYYRAGGVAKVGGRSLSWAGCCFCTVAMQQVAGSSLACFPPVFHVGKAPRAR
ncbi:Hypothetical predicted protein [Podarcis lilfordi]|uniref:Uncharacterized protein n=1 Tax=Podarcis lilfordi TaxID=74358 RepID=A0AA35P2R1_9SAUR|nr:Hypothetical predicted protein [Podarcis lilfordi]